ncbi:MAG: enoyl-CoA hydratase/isomerase family protein [Acidimicrobiia bacterium]|nr:enoyl-CoA hydratase/isomerase family protein [Acidimicrobiia bacterium]
MFIEITDRGQVRWLTLNQPGRKNAIPAAGWAALESEFAAFEASDQRVLIVTGAGDEFCSGADLGGDRAESISDRVDGMKQVGAAALGLHRLTKPTIAAVDGIAAGAGMNLALGCDIVLASTRARFTEIFVRRGLTVDFGGTWLLPRLVGLQRAKELVLSGRIVGAREAKEIGLVLEVVDPSDLVDRAREIAELLASSAPIPQMFAKRTMNRSFELSFEEALEAEHQGQLICFQTEDVTEGVASFLEKRPPEFNGR